MPPGGPTFDSLDLKLMHHYCTSTAATISFSPKAQDVWRDVIPKYAYTHHMLMHAILTLSANHYVNVHKSSLDAVTLHEYRTRALYHHQLGLQLFRQQVQTPGEDQSNEIALVFAAVLGMLTFADAGTEQGPTSFDDGVKLLSVLRGKQALWRSGRGLSESSIFAPAFFDPPPPERRTDYSSTALALGRLYDSTQDEVCKGTITVLKGVAERQPNSEYRTLGTWPASGSEDFLHLLQSRDEVALQIFEHYCTILESKSELWWVGDFGQKLRVAIRNERWLGGTPNAAKRVSES
ncbi:hypothetical protein MBLNU13_g11640t1 [Cladosporium sp. NU13]